MRGRGQYSLWGSSENSTLSDEVTVTAQHTTQGRESWKALRNSIEHRGTELDRESLMLLPGMSNTRLSDPHHPTLKKSNFASESKINVELHESSNTGL